jgi:GTP 3',8-cyclase
MSDLNIDNHKLMYHPQRVAEWLSKGDCFPVYVEIGLTDRCNHKCVFCALDWLAKDRTDFKTDVLLSGLSSMAECGVKSVMFAGEGEPLLHPDFIRIVRHAREQGLDISTTSNGVLFTPAMAEEILADFTWIRFSVNGSDPESYSKIHNTNIKDFDKVMANLAFMAELKKKKGLKTTIGVQMLLLPDNIPALESFAEKCRAIGVDNIQIKPYSHHPSSKNDFRIKTADVDEIGEKLMRLQTDDFKVFFRAGTIRRIEEGIDYPECFGLPFFALVDVKGNVIPCNLYYGREEYNYGNLSEKSFKDIWTGEKRKGIIRKIHKNGVTDCRKGCRLDVINRYLDRLKNPEEHDNFI